MRTTITLAVIITAIWYSRANTGERPTPPRGYGYGDAETSAVRSPKWPSVRRKHLDANPYCAACGAKATEADLEVHHIRPYHLDPSLELDPNNLITLCRSGRNCHLYVGHDPDGPGEVSPNWKSENKNVQRDAAWLLARMNPGKSVAATSEAAPTPYAEVQRVLSLLPVPQVGYADLGCGDGRWLLAAAERWPDVRITGVEIDPARAAATRERVRAAGLDGQITVITGDATSTDVQADVGTAYLYQPVLDKLTPRIEKMTAFASYIHKPSGLPVTKNGDSWIYSKPVPQVAAQPRAAVWNGHQYSQPLCDNPNCGMCNGPNGIRAQLAAPVPVTYPKSAGGHFVRVCNGKSCWLQWVAN